MWMTPARLSPMTMRRIPPTWRSCGRTVDERPAGERRGDAEEGEDGPEPGDVGERVAEGQPARWLAWPRIADPATATAVSWAR